MYEIFEEKTALQATRNYLEFIFQAIGTDKNWDVKSSTMLIWFSTKPERFAEFLRDVFQLEMEIISNKHGFSFKVFSK